MQSLNLCSLRLKEPLFDQEIDSKAFVKIHSHQPNWHRLLALHPQPLVPLHPRKHPFVNALRQTWTSINVQL